MVREGDSHQDVELPGVQFRGGTSISFPVPGAQGRGGTRRYNRRCIYSSIFHNIKRSRITSLDPL